MKLYVEGIKIIDTYLLKEISVKTIKKQHIISEQGVIELHNDKMFLLKPNDVSKEIINIDKFRGFIDKSKFIQDEIWYQIPHEHHFEQLTIHTYKLSPNALVELVIVEEKQ